MASACIKSSEDQKNAGKILRKWTKETYASVLNEYRNGAKLVDISHRLGLSASRVSVIIKQAIKLEQGEPPNDPFDKLTPKTRNCLLSQNICNADDVRAALEDGRIDNTPYIGKVTKAEIINWLADLAPGMD